MSYHFSMQIMIRHFLYQRKLLLFRTVISVFIHTIKSYIQSPLANKLMKFILFFVSSSNVSDVNLLSFRIE